jgi:catechol 2,3-dioxygenase-like lactoylglutathione lyase family enzyme
VITGLDHVAVVVGDIDAATDGYRRLLGVEPDAEAGGGAQRRWFRFANAAFELIAPDGEGPAGERVRARLKESGEGIWALAFATPDPQGAAKLLTRRGLRSELLENGAGRIEPEDAAGVPMFFRAPSARAPSRPTGDAPVAGLDHVVVGTTNPDRALAIYGAKLGLDLRLDRANPQWGARQMFFKAGDALIEIGVNLKEPTSERSDRFGGLAWRVAVPEAAHARMAAAGFDVSELRTGRKPGTRVFTVRDAPAGVPTLVIQQNVAMEAA